MQEIQLEMTEKSLERRGGAPFVDTVGLHVDNSLVHSIGTGMVDNLAKKNACKKKYLHI